MSEVNLGELMAALYDEFLVLYQDEEVAACAAAATINAVFADYQWAKTHEIEYAA